MSLDKRKTKHNTYINLLYEFIYVCVGWVRERKLGWCFFFFFGPLLFCVLSSTTGVSGTYVLTYSNHCD